MNALQAKDFLVQAATEQAALDVVPLSDLEKRMMYFTESDPTSCADPMALNDEFEAQLDTAEYEAKVSRLFDRARERLKQENPEQVRLWNEAVFELLKGDHYILIPLNTTASIGRPEHDFLKLVGTALLVAVGLAIAALAAEKFHLDLKFWFSPLLFVFVLAWIMFSRQGRQLLGALLGRRK